MIPATTAAAQGVPYTPAADSTVLEHVAVPRLPGSAPLGELRAQWRAQPGFLQPAAAYARAALEIGRREEDPRYFGYAESALQAWWNRAEPPAEVLQLRAALRLARHDYTGAGGDLDRLIAARVPESVAAHLTRARLRTAQGQPRAALEDCAAVADTAPPLAVATCKASAASLLGRAAENLDEIERALVQGQDAPLPMQLSALQEAADIADRIGRIAVAQDHYDEALRRMEAAGTRDVALLAAAADFLLDRDAPLAVVQRTSGLERIDSLLLRQAMAEQRLGQGGDAAAAGRATAHAALLSVRFAELRQRSDRSHLREQALFELALGGNPAGAVQLAAENWQMQREPIDARILMKAALAAEQAGAAQPVLEWMQATGIEDRRLQPLASRLRGAEQGP